MHPVAARRILRLGIGTAAALWFSQVVNWNVSFIMPVLVSFLLAVPIPAPRLKGGIIFILALALPAYGVLLLLPVMDNYHMVAILILIAACFWSFYYSAKGGSPVLGAFLTMGQSGAQAQSANTRKGGGHLERLAGNSNRISRDVFFPSLPGKRQLPCGHDQGGLHGAAG